MEAEAEPLLLLLRRLLGGAEGLGMEGNPEAEGELLEEPEAATEGVPEADMPPHPRDTVLRAEAVPEEPACRLAVCCIEVVGAMEAVLLLSPPEARGEGESTGE